jgi:cytidine deaminase
LSIERPELERLLDAAIVAAAASWSPYSRFPVGAALAGVDGSVITGTNVENRSYGLTICAERTAVGTAVGRGVRGIRAVAVYCAAVDEPVPPCGACRQVLTEFGPPETPVIYAGRERARAVVTTLGALLPADSLHDLGRRREDRARPG